MTQFNHLATILRIPLSRSRWFALAPGQCIQSLFGGGTSRAASASWRWVSSL